MFKIYSILPPPFNKFAVFILYGLLSVALITLAQEDTITNSFCILPLEPFVGGNKITIGYVQLFSTSQPGKQNSATPKTLAPDPIPKVQWNNYDYINVIAYPSDGKWHNIYRPDEDVDKKLKPIDDLVNEVRSQAFTKILLSIRDYNVGQWPQGPKEQEQQVDGEYQRIIEDAIKTINDFRLDGIDIEYPGMRGSLCKNPWDKRNDDRFINFLTTLRAALNGTEGQKKTLMLTVGRDVVGNLKDEIENIDFLNIETYHHSFYQNLKEPNPENYKSYPNSPLNIFGTAYESWTNTGGIDSKKIIMGVDFGNTIQMIVDNAKTIEQSQTVTFPKNVIFDVNGLGLESQTKRIQNPCEDDVNDINQMKLYSWAWRHLSNSALDPKSCNIINNNINFNWTRNFGQVDESKTPWLYSAFNPKITPNNYLYVSYEDFVSLRLKLEFAKNNSIGGMSISDVTFDDDKSNLLNFMQPIRGKSAVGSSSPPNGSGNGKSKSNPNDSIIPNIRKNKAGVIAGSVIGVIFGLALLGSCAYMYRQKVLLKSEAGDIKTKGAHTTSKIEMASEQLPNRFGSPTTVLPVASGHVTAMFDFIGKEENDLSFKKGDVIEVLEKGDGPNDWWVGRVNGIVGEFPGNYVKET